VDVTLEGSQSCLFEGGRVVADSQVEPFVSEIKAMKERMDILYRKSCGGAGGESADTAGGCVWVPEVDVLESDREWVFLADLPGVSEGDLNVEVADNRLKISGNRPSGAEALHKCMSVRKALTCERKHGPFLRLLSIPEDARQDEIHADLKNGVLRVVVPKHLAQHASEHKITVHSR
jgi:HSP20 family molecular chaperone IbpA